MMTLREALQAIADNRRDCIVVTTMASVGVWPQLSDTPRDFAYIPSSMGQGAALGLGLALARLELGIIVVSGDGSLLMNLGCLVTIASYPANLYLIVMDNRQYEVTGGQPTAGAGRIDFAGLARASGIERVYRYDDAALWSSEAAAVLSGPGPVFVWLHIESRLGEKTPRPPRPMSEQLERLQAVLAGSVRPDTPATGR